MPAPLHVHTIVSQPFAENTYIAWLPGRTDCVVIDPGLEPDLILDFLKQEGLRVAAVLNTHGHADHIAGNEAMKEAFADAPLVIGTGDEPLLTDPMQNLSALFGISLVSPAADRTVKEGDIIEAAELKLEVLDVPGHSPGHVAFLWRDPAGEAHRVFGGDVLFRGSIGRYDFPGSSGPLLFESIRQKLFPLPPDTVVYPGHGPVTTVGHEQKTNPFLS